MPQRSLRVIQLHFFWCACLFRLLILHKPQYSVAAVEELNGEELNGEELNVTTCNEWAVCEAG